MARTRSADKHGPLTTASTADRLLAGAADLFRRKGYAATTTREISAVLGIQNASLYYHVQKKEDLLYKLCLVTLEDVARELVRAGSEKDPITRLKLMIYSYVTLALRDRDGHTTMLVEMRALSEGRRTEIVSFRDRNVAIVRNTFAAAQKMGQIRSDITPKYLTLAMFNLVNWSIFWFRPDGELSAEQIANLLGTIFLDGVATNRAQKGIKRPPARRRAQAT